MAIGAYAVERDYSHYVSYAAKTVFAVVGTATKGPVNVATVCTSIQDFINKFGPLSPDCLGLYAGQYFLSQSSKLYYVRAATDSAKGATVVVPGTNASSTEILDAVTISVLEVGTYANSYKLQVEKLADKFKLSLKNGIGNTLESVEVPFSQLTVGYSARYFKVTAVSNSSPVALTEGTYDFSGGSDGIEDITSNEYNKALDSLAADTVDMNLFAVPGVSEPATIQYALSLAENRGDCLFLVDPPNGLTKDGVVEWHNGGGEYEHTAFNSSYGALYYDWCTIYDSVNKVYVDVPPSVPVAATIAYSDRTSEVWYAPAGLRRGLVRGVLNTKTPLSKGDVDYIYGGENNVNAIYEDPQAGLVLWGQKTLYRNNTALNRVNVRRLLNYLKRVISAACNYLTFEPNDYITWNSFEMMINPVLRSIQKRRGIQEYRIVKGETIVTPEDVDNYKMPCMVLIRPTKAAEEIPIYFVLTSSGADFNEVLDANGITNL